MIRGMRTNSEYVQKILLRLGSMSDAQIAELIAEYPFGKVVAGCKLEQLRRAEMDT